MRVACAGRAAREKVGVQGQDDVGAVQLVVGVQIAAEGEAGSGPRRVRTSRAVLVPFRVRIGREQSCDLRTERWRGGCIGEQIQSLAASRLKRCQAVLQR